MTLRQLEKIVGNFQVAGFRQVVAELAQFVVGYGVKVSGFRQDVLGLTQFVTEFGIKITGFQ